MGHDKVVATLKFSPQNILLAADQRRALAIVVVDVDDLVALGEDDGGVPGSPVSKAAPVVVLVCQGRVPNAGHEGWDEPNVVQDHPANVHQDAVLQGSNILAARRVSRFSLGDGLELGGQVVAGRLGGGNGLL